MLNALAIMRFAPAEDQYYYLGVLYEAALAAGAPTDYLEDLRSRPCRSVGP